MLSEHLKKKIDSHLSKYPSDRKQSAVIAALACVQKENGWLSKESIQAVADYLGIPDIAVYEVANFYTMFNINPVGEYKIRLCTNLPCLLKGADVAELYLKKKLGIGFSETTKDNMFTLQKSECMGACGDAPVLTVNDRKMCSFMTNEKIDKMLEELSK